MAVTIEGIKITHVSISRSEDGAPTITGGYELKSSAGITLAKQSFNGYNDIKLNQSPATQKLLLELLGAVSNDLNATLGLN